MLDLTLKVCFSDNDDCALNIPVLEQQRLPKVHCTWNEASAISGKF